MWGPAEVLTSGLWVIASKAKQSRAARKSCWIASLQSLSSGPRFARTRWLIAMTSLQIGTRLLILAAHTAGITSASLTAATRRQAHTPLPSATLPIVERLKSTLQRRVQHVS
jgi:hypothetical protein